MPINGFVEPFHRDSSSLPSTTQGAQTSVLFFVLHNPEQRENLNPGRVTAAQENLPEAEKTASLYKAHCKAERGGAVRFFDGGGREKEAPAAWAQANPGPLRGASFVFQTAFTPDTNPVYSVAFAAQRCKRKRVKELWNLAAAPPGNQAGREQGEPEKKGGLRAGNYML